MQDLASTVKDEFNPLGDGGLALAHLMHPVDYNSAIKHIMRIKLLDHQGFVADKPESVMNKELYDMDQVAYIILDAI